MRAPWTSVAISHNFLPVFILFFSIALHGVPTVHDKELLLWLWKTVAILNARKIVISAFKLLEVDSFNFVFEPEIQ